MTVFSKLERRQRCSFTSRIWPKLILKHMNDSWRNNS